MALQNHKFHSPDPHRTSKIPIGPAKSPKRDHIYKLGLYMLEEQN